MDAVLALACTSMLCQVLLEYHSLDMHAAADLTSLKDKGVEAASAIKTMQALLNMIPGAQDSTGFVGGMQSFLGVATNY